MGDHPVRVVETMNRIVRDVEDSPEYDQHLEERVPDADDSATDALARSGRSRNSARQFSSSRRHQVTMSAVG